MMVGIGCADERVNVPKQIPMCSKIKEVKDQGADNFFITVLRGNAGTVPSNPNNVGSTNLILSTRAMLTEPGVLLVVVSESEFESIASMISDNCDAIVDEAGSAAEIKFSLHAPRDDMPSIRIKISNKSDSRGQAMLLQVLALVQAQQRDDAVQMIQGIIKMSEK